MPTRAELQLQVTTLIEDGQAIASAAAAGEYSGATEYEADVNDWRRQLLALLALLEAEWGVESIAVVVALRALAARMLDLRATIAESPVVVSFTVDRTISAMELAVQHFGDPSRWTELMAMNRGIRHPGFIPAGTVLVRHGS